ncbi:MAG TPA: hypothetical protein VK806_05745 [Bacteroidia bacterium]|nr:hypothetical protein [Bacteroidia bacterium]
MKKPLKKTVALTVVFSMLFQLGAPTCAYALTGGPSQPEVQSFEPVSTSDMVDPFSGGFTYNIPLLNVDGYPINISYHNGITMDQEASWCGLGWNINPGVINRNVRGLPDDFDGDVMEKDFNMKENDTYGVSVGAGFELFGFSALSIDASLGVHYNNYNGVGADLGISLAITASLPAGTSLTGSLGLNSSSDEGMTITKSIGLSYAVQEGGSQETSTSFGLHTGSSFNSRTGMTQRTIGVSVSQSEKESDAAHAKFNPKEDKTGYSDASIGATARINPMQTTFSPQVTNPMFNLSITGSFKLGLELFGGNGSANISGYFSSQQVATNVITNPAYGYMHAEDGVYNSNAMMDFNREKDMPFTNTTPDLPLANFTYDIFSVSGQGAGGSYRSFRGDLGHVFDPYTASTSNGYNIGAEVGAGNLVHVGVDLTMNTTTSYSQDWTADNYATSGLSFKSSVPGNPLYEPTYLKEANEKTVETDPAFFQKTGGYSPERIQLNQLGDFYTVGASNYSSGLGVNPNNYRNARDIRNQSIIPLTRGQLKKYGLEDPSSLNLYPNAQPYHIAEITSLATDGKRYVYGIAAYNTKKEETTFAVGGSSDPNPNANASTGLVSYSPEADNTINNALGTDNYYSSVITPPYAHSYLLTAVLSPDYVDADSIRGPSEGDLGTWTKFNYTKIPKYNWRIPVEANEATYNESKKSDPGDDRGNYLYGEKELWYLNSIETKNYIAIFTTTARQDARGVLGRDGGINLDTNAASRMLNMISLYAKPNYNAHLANPSIPLVPIEQVHFEYDYSLCPGVPNNASGGGKLTLKRIYFTYQTSFKGRLSPYIFKYSNTNPAYNIKASDRWGFYKPDTVSNYVGTTAGLSPGDYPYVEQNKHLQDSLVKAWTLTDITLPSGGAIHVDFESNDYAYVQNLPAEQMSRVDGNSVSGPASEGQLLSLVPGPPNQQPYLLFKLQKDQSGNYITNLSKYFSGMQYLYFRFLMQITPANSNNNYNSNCFEYVSGYLPTSQITASGLSSTPGYGWLQLGGVTLDDNGGPNYCPIIRAALQYGRTETPRLVFNEPNISGSFGESVLEALVVSLGQFLSIGQGINQSILGNNPSYCTNFVADKSWIRLNNVTGQKLGDGARVKDIMSIDQWNGMTGGAEPTFDYGQEYSYTTTLSDGTIISSGVASYEPQIGGDENVWKQPVFYNSTPAPTLVPDDKHYMETPFGESFFPSASVGYSVVSVKNLQHANVHRNATGTVVHDFYTSYDFPTITNQTDLQEIEEKTDPYSISSLLNIDVRDYMTASEGYVIQNNDMNGKPKGQQVYQEDQTVPISTVAYYYKRTPYNTGSYQLDNNATVINSDGSIGSATIGVFYDNVEDFRESETDNVSGTLQLNDDGFLLGFIPIDIPLGWPAFSSSSNRFRSTVTTKVINTFGLLDSTIVTDLGSTVKTQNLAYDANTGEVLLTKTANDFNDSIFNLTYPAYWYYDGMGQAYRNIGLRLSGVPFSSGTAMVSNASQYFVPGDELALTSPGDSEKVWVTQVTGNTVTTELKNGNPPSGTSYNLEVIRSGRRNMQTMDMAKLTTLLNPIYSLQSNSYQKVTQASAKIYTDSWRTYCNCFEKPSMETDNPYVLGTKGNYRLKTSLLYLTPRDQSNFDNNTNIRQDGTFNSYNPFYSESGGSWTSTPQNWTFTSEVTDFNPYGQEIEDKDALGRYSSATFGYNQTLPTAVAANSEYQEMGFDGFEDYGFKGCADNHLDVNRSAVTVDSTQAHTGWHSLLVSSGNPVIIGGQLTTCSPYNPCNISLCYKDIAPNPVRNGIINIDAIGGTAPYTYSYNVTSGSLPVSMGADGSLNIPYGNAGTITITATDSKGCTTQVTAVVSNNGSITGITQCPVCNLTMCYTLHGHGVDTTDFHASGGTQPYTFTITDIGTDQGGMGNCNIHNGIQSGADFFMYSHGICLFYFTITVTDANGCTFSITVHHDGEIIPPSMYQCD